MSSWTVDLALAEELTEERREEESMTDSGDWGKGSNADYVKKRNLFIKAAEKYANAVAGPQPVYEKKQGVETERDRWNSKWSRAFHWKMDDLWDSATNTKERR